MAESKKIAVIVGSLRKESFNRKLANVLIKMAPESLKLEIVEIGQLPLFNQDFESDPPPAVREFKQSVEAADALLFVTPEYNRSVPGVLKNALDVGSRPYGKSSWNGKPGGVITLSSGAIGGFGANHHLRQSLVFLNIPVMPQPEAYIGNAGSLFDEQGNIAVDASREFLKKYLLAFEQWVNRTSPR